MSINEERLKEWIEQVTKKLAHLEANQIAIINGDFCDTNTEPKEPLIKDEKIRKAVRAWAEAECITKAYLENDYTICRDDDVDVSINFCVPVFKDVGGTSDYTIAELCGTPEPLEPKFIDLDERVKDKEKE